MFAFSSSITPCFTDVDGWRIYGPGKRSARALEKGLASLPVIVAERSRSTETGAETFQVSIGTRKLAHFALPSLLHNSNDIEDGCSGT